MLTSFTHWRTRRPTGFTMIELLVVIAVLVLLIGLVTAVAGKAIRQQTVRNTQQIMQNATLALEQFATENPLRAIYDVKDKVTFGKYPPYQLDDGDTTGSVANYLEKDHTLSSGDEDPPDTIQERLAWDMSGRTDITLDNWVVIEVPPAGIADPDTHNDNRALYAYLKVFGPESLKLIPESSLKPLYPQLPPEDRSYVNSRGLGAAPGNPGAEDILAIHDAWGVPLDYMLYVKCELRPPRPGETSLQWEITERVPVLRSRGIKREVYDVVTKAGGDLGNYVEKQLFSVELPKPWAGLADFGTGELDNSLKPQSRANGWLRAVGLNEDYRYRPPEP